MQILFVLMGDFFFFAYETNVAQHLQAEGVKRGSLGVWEGRGRGSGQRRQRGGGVKGSLSRQRRLVVEACVCRFLQYFITVYISLHSNALIITHYFHKKQSNTPF